MITKFKKIIALGLLITTFVSSNTALAVNLSHNSNSEVNAVEIGKKITAAVLPLPADQIAKLLDALIKALGLTGGMATINVINPIKTLFTNLQLKIVSQKSYFWDTIFYDIKV